MKEDLIDAVTEIGWHAGTVSHHLANEVGELFAVDFPVAVRVDLFPHYLELLQVLPCQLDASLQHRLLQVSDEAFLAELVVAIRVVVGDHDLDYLLHTLFDLLLLLLGFRCFLRRF